MSHREWILVVESDPWVADSIRWSLAETGLHVVVVNDGLAALEAFFKDPAPTLVTLELDVPSVSGFRLIDLFKHHFPRIPVLLVTRLQFEEAADAIRAGADDFISKPFRPDLLARRVFARIAETSTQNAASVDPGPCRQHQLPNDEAGWRIPAGAQRSG